MVSRFISAGLDRDHDRAEDHEQQQRREHDHDPDEQRQLVREHVREVDRARGEAADEHGRRRSGCSNGGSTSSRRWLTRFGRGYRLRRRAGIGLDHRDVARRRDPRRRDRDDVRGSAATASRRAGRSADWPGSAARSTISSGPLNPAPKPAASRSKAWRVLVLGRVVAGVAAVQPQRRHRHQQQQHHRQRDDRQRPRCALHRPAPARARRERAARAPRPARRRPALGGSGRRRRIQPLRASRGPNRDSIAGSTVSDGEHRQQHGDHGRDRQPVHERDAGREHAEQGDHHGVAGEQDRAPGRVHRLDHGAPRRRTAR